MGTMGRVACIRLHALLIPSMNPGHTTMLVPCHGMKPAQETRGAGGVLAPQAGGKQAFSLQGSQTSHTISRSKSEQRYESCMLHTHIPLLLPLLPSLLLLPFSLPFLLPPLSFSLSSSPPHLPSSPPLSLLLPSLSPHLRQWFFWQ